MNIRNNITTAGICFLSLTGLAQDIQPVYPEKWNEVEKYIQNSQMRYVETSSVLPKPYSYALNPGTLYYWDLYFINEGLMMQGFMEQALNNIDNFIFEIDSLGFIPNAISWAADRSQTPYFAMMVRSYYEKSPEKDKEWLRKAYRAVLAEYEFWTNTGGNQIEDHQTPVEGLQRFHQHSDTASLIRFYDRVLSGRFKLSKDIPLSEKYLMASRRMAEAETMDFTPRFEGRCTDFIAVDLNANLYQYEMNLAFFGRELGIPNFRQWEKRAKRRADLINRYCWSAERGLYLDYDFVNNRHSQIAAITTVMPLYWGFASKKQASGVKNQLALFDSNGGLVVCEPSEQTIEYQWGHKTVWPPMQYLAMSALNNYGFHDEARHVAMKYLNVVTRNYVSPAPVKYNRFRHGPDQRPYGFIWEKYDRNGDIDDSEYSASEMMGWTASTYLKALELIRAESLEYARKVVRDLSSPKFRGRGYVDKGVDRAAGYIRRQYSKIGLQAFNHTYDQPFQITVNTFPSVMKLQIDGTTLVPGKEYLVHPSSPSLKGEYAIHIINKEDLLDDHKLQDHLALSSGKVLIIDGSNFNPTDQDQNRKANEAIASLRNNSQAPFAAIIVYTNEKLTWSFAKVRAPNALFTVKKELDIKSIHKVKLDVKAKMVDYTTKNVIGYIEGKEQPDSFLVVVAHYDHLGKMGSKTYFPGANDNASGIAMMLSMATHFAVHPPKYSMAFMAFSAEEAGILGARYYVDHPLFDPGNIKFFVNTDMAGTGGEGIMVVNGSEHRSRFDLLSKINDEKGYVASVRIRGAACNSDHCPFHEKGVKSIFIYTIGGTAYHDPDDRYETLPFTAFVNYSKLLIEFFNRITE